MTKLAKWKIETYNRLYAMSLADLLDEVLNLSCGDDWDGCFTARGDWEFTIAQLLLKTRLSLSLPQEFKMPVDRDNYVTEFYNDFNKLWCQ